MFVIAIIFFVKIVVSQGYKVNVSEIHHNSAIRISHIIQTRFDVVSNIDMGRFPSGGVFLV